MHVVLDGGILNMAETMGFSHVFSVLNAFSGNIEETFTDFTGKANSCLTQPGANSFRLSLTGKLDVGRIKKGQADGSDVWTFHDISNKQTQR